MQDGQTMLLDAAHPGCIPMRRMGTRLGEIGWMVGCWKVMVGVVTVVMVGSKSPLLG